MLEANLHLNHICFFHKNRPNVEVKHNGGTFWVQLDKLTIYCPTLKTAENLAAAFQDCFDEILKSGESHVGKTDEPIVSDIPY